MSLHVSGCPSRAEGGGLLDKLTCLGTSAQPRFTRRPRFTRQCPTITTNVWLAWRRERKANDRLTTGFGDGAGNAYPPAAKEEVDEYARITRISDVVTRIVKFGPARLPQPRSCRKHTHNRPLRHADKKKAQRLRHSYKTYNSL